MNNFSLAFKRFDWQIMNMQLSMPYDYNTVKNELDNEVWDEGQEINTVYWPGSKRFKCMHPTRPILKEINDYFLSPVTRRIVTDACWDNLDTIRPGRGRWELTKDQLYNCTSMHAEFTKDLPGMDNSVHLDYKFLICTGLIYLTEKDDPKVASFFYDDKEMSNPRRWTTEFGNGWMHMNDYNTWHSGGNFGDEVRYTMLIGLTLTHNPSFR